MNIRELLAQNFLENTIQQYCWLLGILLFGIIFKKIISKLLNWTLYKFIKRYSEEISSKKLYELIRKPMGWLIMMIFIFLAFIHIDYPKTWNLSPINEFGLKMVIERVYFLIFSIVLIWLCLRLIDFLGLILMKKAEKTVSKADDQLIPFVIDVLKVVVVILGIFIILGSIFKLEIGSLVAGLGIGGLAVALAAKDTLENLFGSFTIFFDKPFVLGDLIKVGDITGVVEKVGFRSTRIRTLDKSYVTIPNRKMVDSELDNLTLRTFRRGYFTIGLKYSTPIDKIKTIVAEIQTYIDSHDSTDNEGIVRFAEFNKSSLDIMVLYYVNTTDWYFYLQIKEEINFKIMEILKKHSVDFAFPSTSIYFENNTTDIISEK